MESANMKPAGTRELPRDVFHKLLFFSLAIIAVPLFIYYMCLKHIFPGPSGSTYSAIAAVVSVNAVVGCFIWIAMLEDTTSQELQKEKDTKKSQ
ncbi:Vacuolar ATPase assembly integral membrane protein vma-21 [Neolecta irregularis DAH-3]|uniref:Vacuolar ATPase assembly integral membrane protein vma-21 n=1 Tax=Neolecta irregularis (strain DAH-3) TaxID=1198029 RepID=A0A1U7LGS1_NEOID|nr:Vacuolar ATPase assembly integral membrane protein vma-21 [Neolecta irregularis DAH-3]|eukprot:OLL21847.1 Vacuolar ATPase assembly integral membrane protein vma-21 [Neolecta irregularis DAH-3]